MNKISSILVVLLCGILLVGCSGGAGGGDVSIEGLFESVKEQIITDLRDNGYGDDDFAAEELPGYNIFDIKGEDADYILAGMNKNDVVEGFVIKASMDLNSDQIVILKVAPGKAGAVKNILETEMAAQLAFWEDYIAEQAQKVRNTIITVIGDYIIYVTYPNPEAIEDIFNGAF